MGRGWGKGQRTGDSEWAGRDHREIQGKKMLAKKMVGLRRKQQSGWYPAGWQPKGKGAYGVRPIRVEEAGSGLESG